MSDTFIFQTELRPDTHTEIPHLAKVYYEEGELKETPLPYTDIRVVERTGPYDALAYKVTVHAPYTLSEGDVIKLYGDWIEVNVDKKQKLGTGYFQVKHGQILPAGGIGRGANEQAMHLCVEKYVQKRIAEEFPDDATTPFPIKVSIAPTNEEGDSE